MQFKNSCKIQNVLQNQDFPTDNSVQIARMDNPQAGKFAHR